MFLAETSIQLVPDGTMFLHLLVVVVMVVILNRTLLKPINRILSDREKQIRDSLSHAQQLEALRVEKIDNYNSTLRSVRSEGYHLLEKERAEALKQKEERIRISKEELSKKVAAELQAMQEQQELVRGELEIQASALSEEITSRVLRPASQ